MPVELLVVLRVTSYQNKKERPDWFSKAAAFSSLLRAVREARDHHFIVRLVLLADGGVPDELINLVPEDAVVVKYSAGSGHRSMIRAYREARRRCVDALDSIVWFAEDDYIYKSGSLLALMESSSSFSGNYMALHYPNDVEWHSSHPSQPLGHVPPDRISVRTSSGVVEWQRITHSNSTFGTSMKVLRQDFFVLILATLAGSPFDHATHLAVQGVRPFSWGHLFADCNWSSVRATWLRSGMRPLLRVAVNMVAVSKVRKRRLYVSRPDMVCHVETGRVGTDFPWREVLRD